MATHRIYRRVLTVDRKYTDLDVRNDRTLAPLAYRYLEQYNGEFQFLNDCKAYYKQFGRLGHAHIRGVLNSMLADPRVSTMPQPRVKMFRNPSVLETFGRPIGPDVDLDLPPSGSIEVRRTLEDVAISEKLYAEMVDRERRSIAIPLPTRWRYPYGMSNHKRSHVIHSVDLTRSCAVLHPFFEKVTYNFYWACQSHRPPSPYEKTLALFSLDDAVLAIQTGNGSHLKRLTVGEKFRQFKWCAACGRATQEE